jgi:hypothetical protein
MPNIDTPQDRLVNVIKSAIDTGADPALCAALQAAGAPGPSLGLLGSDDPLHRITAGQLLALWLRTKGDVVGAHAINRFLACRAVGYGSAQPLMLANILTSVCAEAVDTGNDAMVRDKAPDWQTLLLRLGQIEAARQLLLHRIEAAINQGDYQVAQELLAEDSKNASPSPALAPIHERLRRKVAAILLRPDQRPTPQDPERVLQLTLDWMRMVNPSDPTITQLSTILDQNAPPLQHPGFPAAPKEVQAIVAAAEDLAMSRSPLHALSAVEEAIGGVLARATASQEAYMALLPAAQKAIAAADRLGVWERGCDTRWIEIVLLRRLNRPKEALVRLQELAARIDSCRRRISDPRWRAGIAVYLRHLPWVTAEVAQACKDGPAMLHAMETAKARILAELRPAQEVIDEPQTPKTFLAAVRAGLAGAGQRAHLLAFLADTTADAVAPGTVGTLALLLTADGALLFHEIKLAPSQISAALKQLERRVRGGTLGMIAPIDPAHPEQRPFDDIIAVLSPLVDWLAPVLGKAIAKGDTLVVSPDGPIHNVPFAMLTLAGEPLIESLAVVAVPSAALLTAPTEAARPVRALALLAPSTDERRRDELYTEEAADLSAFISVATISDDNPLATAVATAPRPVLLHIAAHGEASTDRPLQDRGIGLNGDGSVRLTAEQMGALDLAGAHVNLRACLVGIATEITSREALGFVWAVLGAGCTALVSAVWAVNILSTRRYFTYFHHAWLAEGQSRAAAHRTACRALRAEGGPYSHPYHWAPFILTAATLTGDAA